MSIATERTKEYIIEGIRYAFTDEISDTRFSMGYHLKRYRYVRRQTLLRYSDGMRIGRWFGCDSTGRPVNLEEVQKEEAVLRNMGGMQALLACTANGEFHEVAE